jgi:hypothetical protein
LYTSTSLGPAANQLSCLVFFLLNLSSWIQFLNLTRMFIFSRIYSLI